MPNPITKHNQKLSNLYFIMLFIVLVYIKVIAMGLPENAAHTIMPCKYNARQALAERKRRFFLSINVCLALTLALNEATINLKKRSIVARTA